VERCSLGLGIAACGVLLALGGCRAAPNTANTPPAAIRFADASAQAGIDFKHDHGGSGRKYLPETGSSGVAWIDYDGDGWADLLLVNCAPLPGTPANRRPTARLYRNRGDGTFEDRTAGSGLDVVIYGQGASAADYDDDGDQDVFISCLGPNQLFRNEGNGRFIEVAALAGVADGRDRWRWHTGSTWLDYDRDGRLDLFVGRYVKWTPQTDVFCGTPGGQKRYCPPTNYEGERCALYRNLGGGRFADVSRASGVDAVIGKWFQPVVCDFNDDGWPDVAVSSDGTQTALFRNEGAADPKRIRFTDAAPESGVGLSEQGMPKAGMGIDLADWRNNGREAILLGNFSSERLSLFEPDSSGLYTDAADQVGMGLSSLFSLTFGVAFLDADRDGWRDAFAANGHIDDYVERFETKITYAELPLFYRNEAGKTFTEIAERAGFARKMVARGCAVADYDHDGDPDLVVTENNCPAHLFRNETQTANHYLRLVLRGQRPNREAIGARVQVTAGTLRQTAMVRAGGHFCSQSELPLTFGLGGAKTARVTVSWPDGSTTTREVGTDRVQELVQEAPRG